MFIISLSNATGIIYWDYLFTQTYITKVTGKSASLVNIIHKKPKNNQKKINQY